MSSVGGILPFVVMQLEREKCSPTQGSYEAQDVTSKSSASSGRELVENELEEPDGVYPGRTIRNVRLLGKLSPITNIEAKP